MIQVLVVEDDPMVAALNKQYVEQMAGFTLSGVASNTDEAIDHLARVKVDLMLLDVYMPGLNGLDFLKRIREQNADVDVILITAASDIEQIQRSLRLGAIDYLIKPFEFDRFQEALLQYKNNYYRLHNKSSVSQQELDSLFQKKSRPFSNQEKPQELPKGLTKNTLQTINESILAFDGQAFSTEDIAEAANISRVSVRKYLKFLTEIGYLEEDLIYGVGRPIYQYRLYEGKQYIIDSYL
ncbi:response regulator [Thalassobacillus devorans]|uniref:response regulator n=1 Tax=Thalassobacillus devorans TaxID=279813 RepID=UPI000491E838|nr:response regulator [Thalassobacillus devorans]